MKLLSRKAKLNLDKAKKYLLACSGGPDSMALFHMLLIEGYNFEVALVNYLSREESNLEENTVKEYCLKNNIKIHILQKKCSSAANFESEPRKIRYNFFESIIQNDAEIYGVLVAHNCDDLLETYLIQKERNNFPTVYWLKKEINFGTYKVIRPLLRYEKSFLKQIFHLMYF